MSFENLFSKDKEKHEKPYTVCQSNHEPCIFWLHVQPGYTNSVRGERTVG